MTLVGVPNGSGNDVVGTVLEAEPPTRLVVTFEDSPGEARDNGPSVVTFVIEPDDTIVRLTVTHENLPNVDMLNGISRLAGRAGEPQVPAGDRRRAARGAVGDGEVMVDILLRIGAQGVAPETAYQPLTTIEGLAGWWASDTSGDPGVGGVIQFRFAPGGFDMLVTERAVRLPTRVW